MSENRDSGRVIGLLALVPTWALTTMASSFLRRSTEGHNVDDALTQICDELGIRCDFRPIEVRIPGTDVEISEYDAFIGLAATLVIGLLLKSRRRAHA